MGSSTGGYRQHSQEEETRAASSTDSSTLRRFLARRQAARCTLSHCDVSGNAKSGVVAWGAGAGVTLRDVQCCANGVSGICAHDGATVQVHGATSTCQGNARHGMYAQGCGSKITVHGPLAATGWAMRRRSGTQSGASLSRANSLTGHEAVRRGGGRGGTGRMKISARGEEDDWAVEQGGGIDRLVPQQQQQQGVGGGRERERVVV